MTANCIMPHCLPRYVVCSVTKQCVGTGRLMCPTTSHFTADFHTVQEWTPGNCQAPP